MMTTMKHTGYYHGKQRFIKMHGDEPEDHILAKEKISEAAEPYGYDSCEEWETNKLKHKGRDDVVFRIDTALYNMRTNDRILVQLDGGYHRANQRQIDRTRNRDDTLKTFAKWLNCRYVVLQVEDVLSGYSMQGLQYKLGLC